MAKAICVDASPGKQTGMRPLFREGDILTVVQSWESQDCYVVLEYPKDECGLNHHWAKSRFIPLSNVDETKQVCYDVRNILSSVQREAEKATHTS